MRRPFILSPSKDAATPAKVEHARSSVPKPERDSVPLPRQRASYRRVPEPARITGVSFYVYMLRCADSSYYVGHTDDLDKRISQHELGLIPGYTHTRRPVKLVAVEETNTREDAIARERQIKGWSRAKKEAFIRSNWPRLQRLSKPPSPAAAFNRDRAQPSTARSRGSSGFAGHTAPSTGSGRTALPAGKLPHDLLAQLLSRITSRDPRVLLGPAVGRDAAVIDNGGPRLLIAKSDPITFASDLIGHYAAHVNANDIACMGGNPTWLLATALLPEGCSPDLPSAIFDQLTAACEELGVTLVGGHTEITIGLDRPIVIGAMLGEVERDRLVTPENARPGDAVILTKGIAIEGTAVLAREARGRLAAIGIDAGTLDRAASLLAEPGISVVPEARAACDAARVRAMHDPTEGGLATAIRELAEATGCGIEVDLGAIAVLPETRAICDAAGLDPLGLLASGSLLICVADADCERVLAAIAKTGVPAARIGSLLAESETVIMMVNREHRPLPAFDRDEVARFLSEKPD